MLNFVKNGDLLKANTEALVNTVNCVGVMGKGIALDFKLKFPDMHKDYVRACESGRVVVGKMHTFFRGFVDRPTYIINFPTKEHWRNPSQIGWIDIGLENLVKEIRNKSIGSISIPPLGCGNGGLDWEEVRALIEEYFLPLNNVDAFVFEPRV